MNLHLSSQIVLNKVPEQYYRPRTAVERSEITRCEKIYTDIFPSVEEGAKLIADSVEKEIKRAKEAGLDAIHDTVHEMARDEARHGKAFAGLLKRYFGK